MVVKPLQWPKPGLRGCLPAGAKGCANSVQHGVQALREGSMAVSMAIIGWHLPHTPCMICNKDCALFLQGSTWYNHNSSWRAVHGTINNQQPMTDNRRHRPAGSINE